VRGLVAAAATSGLLVSLAIAAGSSAAAAVPVMAAAQASGASISVSTSNGGVVIPGQDVTASVVISNTGPSILSAGQVSLSITTDPLDDRGSLNTWDAAGNNPPATRQIGASSTTPIGPGNSITATVVVPAAALALTAPSTSVFGLEANLVSAGDTVASGFGSLVWSPGGDVTRTNLTVAMPITAPASSTGLISSADLATYTAPDGLLTRELNAAEDQPDVALGIDPMIIASIRVLGSSAPASAQAWLLQLGTVTNDVFPLQYGDADVAAQIQSGLSQLLSPLSFNYALNPSNFRTPPPTVGETSTPTPTTTPTPTRTPSAGATPTPTAAPPVQTMEQLLSWTYTLSGIAWPPDNSVKSTDFPVLAKNGLTTTIVNGANTNAASLKSTPTAALTVSGGTALVADTTISDALRSAVDATSEAGWNAAMADLNSQLALVSGENVGGSRVILATLGRGWPSSLSRATQTFSSLNAAPWVQPSNFRTALTAPPTQGLQFKDSPESTDRINSVNSLVQSETDLTSFSSVLQDPTALTGPTRNSLLAMLGVNWLEPQADWTTAVAADLKKSNKTLSAIQISPPENVNLLNSGGNIPITVSNAFDLPATVVLRAIPSNGRLEIDGDTTKTIPAGASAKVLVPVKAKLGNGKVTLSLQLFSQSGVIVGAPKHVPVDVHADWEGIGALIIGALVVLLFGFGLVRSILRRRRERDEDAEPSAEDQGVDGHSVDGKDNDSELPPTEEESGTTSPPRTAPRDVPPDATAPEESHRG
jgi:hypothetical protein